MLSRKPLIPYVVWMALFVVIPMIIVIYYAFTDESGAFTLENLQVIPKYGPVILDSLKIALISTVICLVLAYPFALIMTNMKVSSQRMMNMIIMLPMWMNFILRIVAWVVILQPNGLLDNILGIFGFGRNTIYHTEAAIVIGIVYNYLPFMILPIYTTLSKISKPLIEASRDLGCNGFNVLRKVIFPLSIPGVITGITMVFVPAASVIVISTRLGGYKLVGDVIESYFKGAGANMNAGSMLSFVLMFIIVICMAIMNKFDNGEDSAIV